MNGDMGLIRALLAMARQYLSDRHMVYLEHGFTQAGELALEELAKRGLVIEVEPERFTFTETAIDILMEGA